MKKYLVVAFVLGVSVDQGWASLAGGDQLGSLNLGMTIPLAKVDATSSGNGKDDIGTVGFSGGGQYLYHLNPNWGFGADFNFAKPGKKTSSSLYTNGDATIETRSIVFMAISRYAFMPGGSFHPYLLGGLGLHNTSLKTTDQPQSGFLWTDTSTAERRTVVDGSVTSFAAALGVGTDLFFNEQVFAGVEGRWQYLGSGTYKATSQFPGSDAKGDVGLFDILARVGIKFK